MYLQKVISKKRILDPDPYQNVKDPQHCVVWYLDSYSTIKIVVKGSSIPWNYLKISSVISYLGSVIEEFSNPGTRKNRHRQLLTLSCFKWNRDPGTHENRLLYLVNSHLGSWSFLVSSRPRHLKIAIVNALLSCCCLGIIETLELMKIDMANFTIQQARPLIVTK